jgi:hypothetical protein
MAVHPVAGGYGPSAGHIEERFSFVLGFRTASPTKAFFGKEPVFISCRHDALQTKRDAL